MASGFGKRQVGVDVGVVVVDAVHLIVDAFGDGSVGLGVLLARVGAALAVRAAIVLRGIRDARAEENELLHLAPVERQLHNLPLVHHLADRSRLGGDQRRVRRNRNLLRDRANAQRDRLRSRLANSQLDARLHVRSKAAFLDRQLVIAHRQTREQVVARRAGGDAFA